MLQAIAAVFSLLAAGGWLWSSTVKLPTRITNLGADMERLLDGLRHQSLRSAMAGAAMAVAAILQTVVFLQSLG